MFTINGGKSVISRFIEAHNQYYPTALAELQRDFKQSCWMWFIFPQIAGLGRSKTSKYYEIQSKEELMQYANNKLLHKHTLQLYKVLNKSEELDIVYIFGNSIDARKLQSHLTLFATIPKYKKQCYNLIDKYFNGEWDFDTIKLYNDWDKEI